MARPFILDLDGTLIPSHTVDNRCYWQAVHDVFGTDGGTLDLTGFRNVTDSGILDQWCATRLDRAPTPAETGEVRRCFLALVETAWKEEPGRFEPLPGVREWLASRPAGRIAIATGGWGHTARFKLRAAGLDRFDLPLATSDEAPTRADIMRHALALLPGVPESRTPVYVGDGPWDVAAARDLGWSFIGIAEGDRAKALLAAGAERVVADFRALLS